MPKKAKAKGRWENKHPENKSVKEDVRWLYGSFQSWSLDQQHRYYLGTMC